MNTSELATLYERVVNEHPEIRLHCPHGHFIVSLTLGVISMAGSKMPTMAPAVGRSHRWGRRLCGDRPESIGNPDFVASREPRGMTVKLSCRRCGSWKPKYDYQRLATELAVHALAGHREYRAPH
jgi:hypothetical protein